MCQSCVLLNILCTINHKDTALNTVKELRNVECVNDTTIAAIDLAIELCASSCLMLDWVVFQCPQCVAPTMAAAATFALWRHYPEDTPAPAPPASSCPPMAWTVKEVRVWFTTVRTLSTECIFGVGTCMTSRVPSFVCSQLAVHVPANHCIWQGFLYVYMWSCKDLLNIFLYHV